MTTNSPRPDRADKAVFFEGAVTKKLQAYVYALADPREDRPLKERIFYIGKGNGNRCFEHACAVRGVGDKSFKEGEHKLSTIQNIHDAKKEVEVHIVSHGLTDQEAFDIEAVLIPILGDTNKVAGHGDKNLWLSKNQINERYDKPIVRADVPLLRGNVLFVSLNQQDINSLLKEGAEAQLEEATLGWWNVGEARSRMVDCIVGVKHGLVVSIFETQKTVNGETEFERSAAPEKKGAHRRSRFKGKRRTDLEASFLSRSVYETASKDSKMLSKIRPSAGCDFCAALD